MTPTIALDGMGKAHGFLRLPHSRDDSAWGHVMIPICVIANGEGPTVLLTGGNHGDEYEGPIALHDLAYRLEATDVAGRVIILPQMNTPAFLAASRTSPIDGGNMNRAFPGDPRGTVTQKIAAYLTEEILPVVDAVLDFHSGGKTLDFLPFAASHVLPDAAQDQACAQAARAFGAPFTVKMLEIDDTGMFDGAVERAGKTFVTTELGGAGMARAETVAIAKRGVRNLLTHLGVLHGSVETSASRLLDMPDGDCFTFAETNGIYEPMVDLGAPLHAGQAVARIWPVQATGQAPLDLVAKRDGLLVARHAPGLIKSGDCAAVVAVDLGLA
ncbi:N(2)-acetyl-L-2,4-diaminobutanoate deacetylase DoeB [Rhodobacteraceae bacterium XHP0102]|nr:N(2)-acetyl-L-2,4-diaminobutanoate deacetylase DoeB [Rhodobacteraceae bacterium XHP0102]